MIKWGLGNTYIVKFVAGMNVKNISDISLFNEVRSIYVKP